jgi:hypothetical protein
MRCAQFLIFDNEVIRLYHRTAAMHATVLFTSTDHVSSHVSAVHAMENLPLEPYEQSLITVRKPIDRIDRQGLLTQNGAKSLEKAAIANCYYEKVPKHSKTFIANLTHDQVVIRAGTRIAAFRPPTLI